MRFTIFLGVVAASPANVKLGEQLGSILSAGISGDPAGFGAAFNAATANSPVTSNSAVEAVARAHLGGSFLQKNSQVNFDVCPVGWSQDGDLCQAPAGFYGCSRRFNNRVMNSHMKMVFQKKCGVEFPMKSESFLATASPVLTVHVQESNSAEGADSATAREQRALLAAVESENLSMKSAASNLLAKANLAVAQNRARMSAAQTSFLGSRIISDVQREAANLQTLASEISAAKGRIAEGGYPAYTSLVHLLNVASEPNASNAAIISMIGKSLATLMKKETTPDSVRNLAGSVIANLSNAPVASTVSDTEGGSGHVNIVVPRPSTSYGPDAAMMALKAGASAADVSGYYA